MPIQQLVPDTFPSARFRWVICQIDALSRCSRLNTLRATLQTLPKSLDETYSRILTKISEEDCQDALYILQWLSFSFRPVSNTVSNLATVEIYNALHIADVNSSQNSLSRSLPLALFVTGRKLTGYIGEGSVR